MKHIGKILLVVISCLTLSNLAQSASSIVVKPLSEAETIFTLSKIGKIAYIGDSIFIYDKYDRIIFYNTFSNVQHIRFSDEENSTPSNIEDLFSNSTLEVLVYPNPTSDIINIKNSQDSEIRIYDSHGHLMQQIHGVYEFMQIDITNYPIGVYVLNCKNKSFKIIKNR